MKIYRIQSVLNNHVIAKCEEDEEVIEFDDPIPFMAGDEITSTEYGYGLINRGRALLASQIVMALRSKDRTPEEEASYQNAVEQIKQDYEENAVMSYNEMIDFVSTRKAINDLTMEQEPFTKERLFLLGAIKKFREVCF